MAARPRKRGVSPRLASTIGRVAQSARHGAPSALVCAVLLPGAHEDVAAGPFALNESAPDVGTVHRPC